MAMSLDSAVSAFGASAKEKLNNPAATGQPEDQLRAPFENLLKDLALLAGVSGVTPVGETRLSGLKTRPDFSVTVANALVGFIELKAPGKGGDPRKYRDPHDKSQWEKLNSLPNVVYTDGNSFTLFQDGELVGPVVKLNGNIENAGAALQAPTELLGLFTNFLNWQPVPPNSPKALAQTTARLCRLLRDEVTEQLALKSEVLTGLAEDWRRLLFPDATDERFADGYAQAVTFGMLMARARGIKLSEGLQQVASELSETSTLIGAALKLLTYDAASQKTLQTSLGTLTRVLDAVDWAKAGKDFPEAWLYFYEDFLEVYDRTLRKATGSYYTPPEVVRAMVSLTDEALRKHFGLHRGLASPSVMIADPAVGTGTFMLAVLRKIAQTIESDEGPGAVKGAIDSSVKRLIAFEMQLGPFAVAQLRILAEIVALTGRTPTSPMRMFVTDTLGNPDDDDSYLPQVVAAIAKSRKEANKIKRDEPITVVIGNPPYKDKAMGLGGWIESGSPGAGQAAPLADWTPPNDWGVGLHSKHLRNLYVYFWRWATWKVYDHGPGTKNGIVCFITAAGFLSGPGFQKMRDYLRRTCDDIWVVDCSPEGHQPEVKTRLFEGVQQPVCIVIASRSGRTDQNTPAAVRFRALAAGPREDKFHELNAIALDGPAWATSPTAWRAPFRPISSSEWASFPALEQLFQYNGSGVQPKRTWVIAPDKESLQRRWKALVDAPPDRKEELFHATLRDGLPADRHIRSVVRESLPGYPPNLTPLIKETGPCLGPVRYAFRSFNRQWIIPDARLITQPNAELWRSKSARQVYITALSRTSPSSGPALTLTDVPPDLDHYKGSFGGRVYPLYSGGNEPNLHPKLLPFLSSRLSVKVEPEDLVAYIAAIAAHRGYTSHFQRDLSTPGLRIPVTADADLFAEAVEIGRTVIWLHTFGERMNGEGRPATPPRMPLSQRPTIPSQGAIQPSSMPDTIVYDDLTRRLHIGEGYVENVDPAVWRYDVDDKQVLLQWFSYRRADRRRPIIGDKRKPSPLGDIQPDSWPSEYTTELLNVLNVLGMLVALEPTQADLLDRVCARPLISTNDLENAGAFGVAPKPKRTGKTSAPKMF